MTDVIVSDVTAPTYDGTQTGEPEAEDERLLVETTVTFLTVVAWASATFVFCRALFVVIVRRRHVFTVHFRHYVTFGAPRPLKKKDKLKPGSDVTKRGRRVYMSLSRSSEMSASMHIETDV